MRGRGFLRLGVSGGARSKAQIPRVLRTLAPFSKGGKRRWRRRAWKRTCEAAGADFGPSHPAFAVPPFEKGGAGGICSPSNPPSRPPTLVPKSSIPIPPTPAAPASTIAPHSR
ncbi:hypothetical protein LG3211_0799 [Lysobacter gummosus]|nr:hypothetical protein LG3211_0799 [Lysobacter gummosus]